MTSAGDEGKLVGAGSAERWPEETGLSATSRLSPELEVAHCQLPLYSWDCRAVIRSCARRDDGRLLSEADGGAVSIRGRFGRGGASVSVSGEEAMADVGGEIEGDGSGVFPAEEAGVNHERGGERGEVSRERRGAAVQGSTSLPGRASGEESCGDEADGLLTSESSEAAFRLRERGWMGRVFGRDSRATSSMNGGGAVEEEEEMREGGGARREVRGRALYIARGRTHGPRPSAGLHSKNTRPASVHRGLQVFAPLFSRFHA